MSDTLADKILDSKYDMGSGSTDSTIRVAIDDRLRCEVLVTWSAVPDDSGLRRVPHIDLIQFRHFMLLWGGEWMRCEPCKQQDYDRLEQDMAEIGCREHDAILALLLDSDIWQETYGGGRL